MTYQLRLRMENSYYSLDYVKQFRKIITMEQIKEMDLIANHLNYKQLKYYCHKKQVQKYSWWDESTTKKSMIENLFSYILYNHTSLKRLDTTLGTETSNLVMETIDNFQNVPCKWDFIWTDIDEE